MLSAWAPALKCNHLLNDTFSSSIFSLHKNVIKPSHTGRRLTCDGRASEENIQKRKNISIVRPPLWPRCLSPHHQFCGTTQQSRAPGVQAQAITRQPQSRNYPPHHPYTVYPDTGTGSLNMVRGTISAILTLHLPRSLLRCYECRVFQKDLSIFNCVCNKNIVLALG